MSSSYLTPFPNLTFKTVFSASLLNDYSKSIESRVIAAFAVTSTTFFNSSLQASVVSRMEINDKAAKLFDLFLRTSTATRSSNLSTIQMTPVLRFNDIPHPDTLINTLKNSTYFCRSLKQLTVRNNNSCRLLPALENLVALEVLHLRFGKCIPKASDEEFSVISRLSSLVELDVNFRQYSGACESFDFLGDLENNDGFTKLSLEIRCDTPRKNFQDNLARLCAKNRLKHLSLACVVNDGDLGVLIGAKLSNLWSLSLNGVYRASSGKIADAIIACSSSLTRLEVFHISDECLIKCAEYLDKVVELRVVSDMVNGSCLREKGSYFSLRLKHLDVAWSCLSDQHLGDGFKHLTSLRKLNLRNNGQFILAKSIQYLAAAASLEELNLGKINTVSLEAIGQLTQLTSLQVQEFCEDLKSQGVNHLMSLVNLRTLTFALSTKEIYDGIFKIAESFPELEHVQLTYDAIDKSKGPKFSRDQVTYLLEKCWPLVRYAVFEYDDPSTAMPYLRQRFPHVSFGDRDEEIARKNQTAISSPNTVPARRPR